MIGNVSLVKPQAILLAEDDDNDFFFLQRAFEEAKIACPLLRVRDGQEAMNYLEGQGEYADRVKHPLPYILLLDLKMPRKNGFDVLSWVRAHSRLRRLPIIVLTSSKEEPDVNRAYDLGVNTYLVKPIKFEGLVDMMRAMDLYWFTVAEKPSFGR
jgi:DNA-binding response OmpR family regulator